MIENIETLAKGLPEITIMEICGGHTNVIMKYGIRDLLPKNIKLISGPGCPVCVSSQEDIDFVIELAKKGIPIATYGDMMRVPGTISCLEDEKAKGAKIIEVYSASEIIGMKDVVFFGVGFETTAPMTAYLLSKGIKVYSAHKLVPPAIAALMKGDVMIDGFINPGHVSTVIGSDVYQPVVPQVITGFSPEQILRGLEVLLAMIRKGEKKVMNAYPEAVKREGNRKAQELIASHFKVGDSRWRGLGIIKDSGLQVRDSSLDAKKLFKVELPQQKETGCRCGDVLRGILEPSRCPLFGNSCTPDEPIGACMVSSEGSCAISYRYSR